MMMIYVVRQIDSYKKRSGCGYYRYIRISSKIFILFTSLMIMVPRSRIRPLSILRVECETYMGFELFGYFCVLFMRVIAAINTVGQPRRSLKRNSVKSGKRWTPHKLMQRPSMSVKFLILDQL